MQIEKLKIGLKDFGIGLFWFLMTIFLTMGLIQNWPIVRYLKIPFGINAFWFPVFFAWLGLRIWRGQRLWLGILGLLFLILGWGPILNTILPNFGGGKIGYLLHQFLLLHLNPAIAWLISMSVVLFGLGLLIIGIILQPTTRPSISHTKTPLVPKKREKEKQIVSEKSNWQLPPLSIFQLPERRSGRNSLLHQKMATARLLEEKLRDFGVEGRIVQVNPGPVVTMYEFEPAPGVKISQIVSLADDLALSLKAGSIRVVAPISGKSVVGIEVPNKKREIVHLREILEADAFNKEEKLLMALGKDIFGAPVVANLEQMPHLLIAGATGTGKSVCLNSIICSLLSRCTPDELRLLIVDPKRIELSHYNDVPHLLYPVITEMELANKALKWAVKEMERRYELLARAGARNIDAYNKRVSKLKTIEGNEDFPHLSYLVILIDELADLMIMAPKEVETSLVRLAQMSRAAGIHLILATQRPSVDVLTGVIKVNFPARISFQVSSKVDSRTILDTIGAERLLGMGDMLFLPPGTAKLRRLHGAYVSEEEIGRIVDFWKSQGSPDYLDDFVIETEDKEMEVDAYDDEKYMEAVKLVVKTGKASISMIQRHLRIGYNRAARLIERMEQEGIISPQDGIKPRKVLIKDIKEI